MPNAVIVDALRTPLGRRNGKLKDQHPVDLSARVLKAIVERNARRHVQVCRHQLDLISSGQGDIGRIDPTRLGEFRLPAPGRAAQFITADEQRKDERNNQRSEKTNRAAHVLDQPLRESLYGSDSRQE